MKIVFRSKVGEKEGYLRRELKKVLQFVLPVHTVDHKKLLLSLFL